MAEEEHHYINDEFKELEANFGDINSTAELHDMIDNLTVYIEELDKQKDLETIKDVLDEIKDRQDFVDDILNYVKNAVVYATKRLSDENITEEFNRTLFKQKIVQYKDNITVHSQFDEEQLSDLEILPDDYVIAKDKKLQRLSFTDLADVLNEYLNRI